MHTLDRAEFLRLAPALCFLFILPFPHTVALRLTCLFIGAMIAVVHWRQFEPAPFPLKIPLLVWAGILLSSLAFAVDLPYSIRELKNELGYTLMAFATFYVFARNEASLRWLCNMVGASMLVISISAITDVATNSAWGSWRFYGGTGAISNFFITATPVVTLALCLWNPPRIGFWLAGAAVLLLCAGTISGQRALWPGLGVEVAVLCLWLWRSRRVGWRSRYTLGAAVLIVALVGAGLWISEQLRTQHNPQSKASMFNDLRPRLWLTISRQLIEHPLQGAGFGQRAMVKAYPEFVPPENPLLWHAHNLLLNYGIYAGLPGVAAVLLLFAALFVRFWSLSLSGDPSVQFASVAGAAMVAGVFARNLFNDFFIRDGALLFWALTGMLLGYSLRRVRESGQLLRVT